MVHFIGRPIRFALPISAIAALCILQGLVEYIAIGVAFMAVSMMAVLAVIIFRECEYPFDRLMQLCLLWQCDERELFSLWSKMKVRCCHRIDESPVGRGARGRGARKCYDIGRPGRNPRECMMGPASRILAARGETSASAGRTLARPTPPPGSRTDPRERGADLGLAMAERWTGDRSPRARGGLDRRGRDRWRPGQIPASAGRTGVRTAGEAARWTDPRERGADCTSAWDSPEERDRSPRARGGPA